MSRTINLSCLVPLVYRGQRQSSKRREQRVYIHSTIHSSEVMHIQGVPDIISVHVCNKKREPTYEYVVLSSIIPVRSIPALYSRYYVLFPRDYSKKEIPKK